MLVLSMELASCLPPEAQKLEATPRVMEPLPGPWFHLAVGYVLMKTNEIDKFRECET